MYKSDQAWESAFAKWSKKIEGYKKYKGTLSKSAKQLVALFEFSAAIEREGDNLGTYAFLKGSEDEGNSIYLRMKGRFEHVATRQGELSSFIRPEILAIPSAKITLFIKSPLLKEWKLQLEKIIRYKPHSLSLPEETLLAMQGQISGGPDSIFRQLNDVDLKWGQIKDDKGNVIDVNHSTFSQVLRHPVRSVRKDMFHAYFKEYEHHKNTIAATYNASVQTDIYYSKVRKYKSSLGASLFADNINPKVYENLIDVVHKLLPDLYRYLKIRKDKLNIKDLHQYDVYTSIFPDAAESHTWDDAVEMTITATKVLGKEYTDALSKGLTSARWCDRYPNIGKHSGAFSSGSYDSQPYILMNFDEKVLEQVFTLAHEAGHSMHTYLANKNQPFQRAGYPIFTAEIASTFNEQLLLHSLLAKADKKQKAFLLNHAVDAIRTTIIRQVMFAEFEKRTHELSEKGEPLTVDVLRKEYRTLLELYFGPDFVIDPELELECLRIPHFYRAFYVYKYATGLIAAIALSQKVLSGGEKEREAYLNMLRSGGSDWPLNLLRKAGLDLEKKESLSSVIVHFKNLIDELEKVS